MRKRVISWLLTVVMVVSLLPTSVLADTLAADQEQQTQQEQIAPADTENTVPAGNEETQEQQEPAPETPVSQMARSGGAAPMLAAAGAVQDIGTAEAFAAMEPGGNYQLTANITVTAPYANDFTGTFDGNGHTVTLDITASTANVGLFSKLAGGAVVKNVKVDGTVSGTEGVAGIAAQANGATISGCINCAIISATGRYVGGIVGKLQGGTVENCYNTGAISSSRNRPAVNLGGIVGYIDESATVKNCYNVGEITVTNKATNMAGIAGWCVASTVENCYYLMGTATAGANGNEQTADPKSAEEMKSPAFAALLGDGFMVKSGDYPALKWETPTAAVRFTIAPANATLEINGGTYTGSTTVALPAADTPYSYTVSCPGYTQQTGSVTVTDKDNPVADPANVTVTLAEDAAQWVTVTFTVTPENATLTLKDGETQVAPTEGTTYQMLKGHAYTYTAETTEEGYEPASGTVTPNENSTQTVALKKVQSIKVTKAPTKTEYYKGDAKLDLTGMVLTVNYDGTDETRTITDGYDAAGVTYEGFSTENPTDSQTVTVKYRGKTATFTIKVNDKLKFADFFTAISESITATDDTTSPFTPVQKPEGNYLESSNTSNYSSSKITLKATKNVTLSFDYLGSASSNSYYCFTVKKGSSTLLTSYSSSAWKSFSVDMAAGDTVTLKFEHPYSYGSHYSVKLKNFTVSPLYTLTIAPDQTDATVTLKDKEGKTVSGSNGVFAVKAAADYTYTVTKKGYEPATGKVTMSAENQTVNVTLVKLPVITLKFTPDDAVVTLKQGNTTVYKESADSEKGKNVYIAAKNTDYTYTVSKFGYETATGTINVATTDVNKTVKLTELAKQTVTFNITKPEGVNAEPAITVNSGSITAYTGSGANCTLPAGDYTYTAKLDGCDTLTGSFVVKAAKTIGLEFVKSLTFNDFFAGLDGITATNGTSGFKPVKDVVCSKRLLNQAVGKSLRTHNLKPKKGAQVMRKNEKITALYERLSRDDFGKDDDQQRESNSISNQKAMLEEFAARQGFTNIVHFTDDGISGTCFDRPGFLAMMKEVEAGNVEYLCIKDMSRMGRDYLKVGQIMEILRQRGVRLIAINDGVDSARGDDDFTPFRNIMNEYYARDTSRKIRSTFQSKGKSGKHLTGTVIYGYLWNEARDQWLVDPEAAEVVKRIFAMTIEGYGPYQIASKLKEEKILIPSAYLAQHGEGVNKNKTFKDVYGWGSSTICNILEKREYLGHTINFKTRKHFKDKKSHYVPEDEWTIFENTHEAIIDQQTFDLVQKIRSKVRRYPDGWGETAPLTGLLYCADCGGKMYVHRTNNGKRISQYTCSQYTKVPCGTLCKTQHRINEDVVLSLVSEMLKAIAEYAKHDRAEFVRVVQEAQSSQQTTEVRKQRTRLATAKQRVSELEVLLCKIYEDNILGKLSDSRYATLDAQYEKEQSELTAEISVLEKAVKSYEKHEKDADRFIALIDKYENFDKLTIAMLNEFIEKILVHERDRKGSIQTTQEVEIYFNFVGRFVPPAFGEVELTPEELEEIRKREERKDRLHQNYLKRKASGAQKRYEDKIKGRKKAEIEAKKAAIRAEDIAKGVFVPVSSLPQREPMKGVQTA